MWTKAAFGMYAAAPHFAAHGAYSSSFIIDDEDPDTHWMASDAGSQTGSRTPVVPALIFSADGAFFTGLCAGLNVRCRSGVSDP